MERTTGAERLTLNVFRIMTGFLFWMHGAQKFMGWLGGVGENGGTADLISWLGLAGILEFFGGALIILGWFTRPVALILAGEMAVAYFWVHNPRGFWPILNGGEKAAFYCFAYLFMAARGGGRFSVDGWRGRK